MRVEMLRGVVGENQRPWDAGSVQEATPHFGRWLILLGKAREVVEAVRDVVDSRDPAPQSRDPKPRKRRG